MFRNAPFVTPAVLLLSSLALMHGANGQEEDLQSSQQLVLERVIVEARKRPESLSDVPISVVVVAGDELEDKGINRMEELHPRVPNLHMAETGIGTHLFIRGIGSGINQGFEQSVGTYVDGVYLGRAQLSRLPFFDLDRVEVLRGPQSTIFGKNSIAGALSFVSNRPDDQREAQILAQYAPELDDRELQALVSGPISERFRGRLAIRSRDSEGYIDNIELGRDEPGRDEQAVRLVLDTNPTDALTIAAKLETAKFDVTGRQAEIVADFPATVGPFTGLTYGQVLAGVFQQPATVLNTVQDYRRGATGDSSENDVENVSIGIDWELGDGTLHFVTGYSAYDYVEVCDCDFTAGDVFSVRLAEEFEQVSQEIRYSSPTGRRVEYIVGAYYQDNSLDFFDTIQIRDTSILVPLVDSNPLIPMPPFPPQPGSLLLANTASPRVFVQDSTVEALFGQATWHTSDRIRLNFGGRFTRETKTAQRSLTFSNIDGTPINPLVFPLVAGLYNVLFNASPHVVSGERDQDKFMPSVQLEWDATDALMAYFSATTGFKSGGFDARSNNPPVNPIFPASIGTFEFEDEEAESFEAGVKMSVAGGRAQINGAIFHTDYDDMQVSSFDGTLGFNVGNAGRARIKGLELEAAYRINESLTFSGALAFTDFEFLEYFGQCYFGRLPDAPDGINCDYAGETNQFVADYSGILSLLGSSSVGSGLQLGWSFDVIFTDDYLLPPTLHPGLTQDAYAKLDARVSIGNDRGSWEVALIGTNLTDEATLPYGNETPLAASTFGTPGFFAFVDPPRSVALQTVFRFR